MADKQQWLRTQLTYDGELWSYSKYTQAVIRKGHRLVVEACEKAAGEAAPTICDIGCGWTDFYGKLQHVVGTYVGIEPAAGQILRAPRKDNMFLIRGVGEKIVLADQCIDLALLVSVLDHCLDAEQTIREVFRVLRHGGAAVILLENRGRLSNDLRTWLGREVSHGEEHLYYFDVDDVLSLVARYGAPERIQSYGFLIGFDHVSRVLPEGVVSALSAAADAALGVLLPKKGQHFLVVAVKPGSGRAAPLRFICPKCGGLFSWRAEKCGACGHELRWIGRDVLDVLEVGAAGSAPNHEEAR